MNVRSGYTLIEVVVAMLVFTVGGLALAAGSAVVGRAMSVNGRRENATRFAVGKLEQFRSSCGTVGSGVDSAGGAVLRWSVLGRPSSITVDETVSYPTPFGTHNETLRASFECP